MNRFQEAVQEFHDATGGSGTIDTPEGRELRAKLILEEAVETCAALGFAVSAHIAIAEPSEYAGRLVAHFNRESAEPDLLEFIDGLCDLTYVTMGAAVNIPVNIERHFEEVHAANMRKLNGPMREDGKVLKPEGWQPPDHAKVLARHGLLPKDGKPFVDTYHG